MTGLEPGEGPGAPEQTSAPGPAPAPREASLGTTAARGFLWSNVGILSRFGAALLLAALLARQLTATEYSAMVALTVVMLYADTALDLGMGAALIYEQEEGQSRRVNVAFSANVAFSIVLGLVAFFLAPLLASVFKLDQYVDVFRSIAVMVVISGLNTVPWALLMRGMQYRPRAVTEIVRDVVRIVVTIALVVGGLGIWGVVWGFVASKAVWTIGTWWVLRYRPVLAWDRTVVGELFAYAWRMAGSRFLGILSLNGDYFIVGNRTSSLDLYYQAFRLPEVVMGGQLNAMSAVLFPMYSRIRSEGTDALRSAMLKALRMVGLFSIPVGIGLALVARDSITVMFATGDTPAVRTMEILSITGCVVGLGFATGDLLYAINRPGLMMRINMVMVPVLLGTMWFVAPHGIAWVAVLHLVVATFFTAYRQILVNRIVEATAWPVIATCWPGLAVALGVMVFALPVRLVTDAGFVSGVLIAVAGSIGGAVAIGLSRSARTELLDLVAKLRGA